MNNITLTAFIEFLGYDEITGNELTLTRNISIEICRDYVLSHIPQTRAILKQKAGVLSGKIKLCPQIPQLEEN